MLRLISCTKHNSHNKTGTAVFIPVIFKGISCFRCELHDGWRRGWDLIRCTINLVVFILMLCEMLSQFILRKSEYFLCLTESVTEASDIEQKPSATELRQQEWIEANCGNIRLSEHEFNATDCCPHRLNKTLFSTGFTTCEPHATHSESRTGCPSAPLLVKYVCA